MNISDIFQSTIASYNDWDGFLINPRCIRKDYEVSWQNRVTGILKSAVRESDLLKMAATGQYTFQITEDGSLIQLYYRFDRMTNLLAGARLAFFQANLESAYEESQLAEYDVIPTDTRELDDSEDLISSSIPDPPIGWMRLDYGPDAKERGIVHSDCHIHFSSFPDSRFIVRGVPSPRQFIEFVIASAYPEKYKEHRLEFHTEGSDGVYLWKYKKPHEIDELNKMSLLLEDNPMYNQMMHLLIPGGR